MSHKIIPALKLAILILLNILVIGLAGVSERGGAQDALSRVGSRGEEVRQIQTKLKQWGYLDGAVDGVYGAATEKAVRSFQRKNGLNADGIAGTQTLRALGINPSSSSGSTGGTVGGFSDSDYRLLARIISAEARGESYEGQVAVGAVVLNRVRHSSFPNTVAGVVYQPGAFSAINDGQINKPVADSCYRAARDVINGWDASGGAIYYYNPDKTSNKWMRSRPVIKRIGRHLFCK